MIGLIKATHHYSKQAALADYACVARIAFSLNLAVPALPLRAGHKRIDLITGKMLVALGMGWEELKNIKRNGNEDLPAGASGV